MSHLDAPALHGLLDGTLPATRARELATHLSDDCDACATVIDQAGLTVDALDRLCAAATAPELAMDPAVSKATFAAILEALPEPVIDLAARRRSMGRIAIGILLAAAVLFVVRVPTQPGAVKGPGTDTVEVTLQAAAGRQRVLDQATLPLGTTLLFQLDADGPASRYLFAVDADGQTERLGPPVSPVVPAGPAQVATGQGPVAYDLDRPGTLRFVGAASARPIDPDTVIGSWLDRTPHPAVHYDVLQVRVAP